ncbi:hypothetical protein cypCar_00039330 [Cyprinus carpio]|nr:hypothetical protein cypCar_00039330 [Cyprinus carpio]
MNFQVLLLVFAVVIATNIHCQAQPRLGDSDKSPVDKSKQQGKTCNCTGRQNALEQNNCPCESQYRILSKERAVNERALCQKKGILTKKCQHMNRSNRKEKKGISMPI